MLYFKNTELAETYHITFRTVLNWIQATKDGKLDLDLHTEKNKTYVANTSRNIATITKLVEERRKYRNSKAVKTVSPRPEFYKLYNEEQIYDIINNLEIHHEIPRQYNYFDGGADHWDAYASRLSSEKTPNVVNSTVKLLEINKDYIGRLLEGYKHINVIDVGVGNAYPVRNLLTSLIAQSKLGRYIAIDISPSMLEIARRNIDKWFGSLVVFEGYERDINYDRFSDLMVKDYLKDDGKDTANLVLLLGGTLANMRYSDGGFRVIHDSMGINDILIHTKKLDTIHTRQFFDFSPKPGEAKLAPIHGLVLELLNITPSYYELELEYDHQNHQRIERVRLKTAITIKFEFESGERTVEFSKNSTVLVWRAHQQSADDVRRQFDRNEFYLLQTSQTEDQEYILTVSRVKRD